jgi:hypothetical protein
MMLKMTTTGEKDEKNPQQNTQAEEQNPCWEDFYDDDCVMSNAAAAGYVAAQWIKSMPCGQGIEVS